MLHAASFILFMLRIGTAPPRVVVNFDYAWRYQDGSDRKFEQQCGNVEYNVSYADPSSNGQVRIFNTLSLLFFLTSSFCFPESPPLLTILCSWYVSTSFECMILQFEELIPHRFQFNVSKHFDSCPIVIF